MIIISEDSMEQHNTGNGLLNTILSVLAIVFGYTGLKAADIDIYLAIILKVMSIISLSLIIAINWKAGIKVIKSIFKKK